MSKGNRTGGQQTLGLVAFIVLVVGGLILLVDEILYLVGGDFNTGIIGSIVNLMSYFVVAWVGWNFVQGKKKWILVTYIIACVAVTIIIVLPAILKLTGN
ncbi:MAG: hypothetical protein RR357_03020 [Clostridia bacterium]